MYTAIKPVYNRKTKSYDVDVVENANILICHQGYLVFNSGNYQYVIEKIEGLGLLQGCEKRKKDAVLSWLKAQVVLVEVGSNA